MQSTLSPLPPSSPPDSIVKLPAKHTTPTPRYADIRTLFPPVAHTRTPQDRSRDEMMEDKINLLLKEEEATAAREQAL